MITYQIKLINNFSSIEFEVTPDDYEEYLDGIADDIDFLNYEHFLEQTVKTAYDILVKTTGAPAVTATKPAPVVSKRIIPDAMKPSEKQIALAKNLGVEDIDQYDRKELGELIKRLIAEQSQ